MNSMIINDFSLFHTLDSGQLFTYYKEKEFYILLVNDAVFKLKQEGNKLFYSGKKYLGKEIVEDDIKELFSLDDNQEFPLIDPYVNAAKKKYSGLRIMKQLPYDTTITFIISQMNNISRITQLSNKLLNNSSRKILFENKEYKLFPLPKELPSVEQLQNLNFGYRAKYLSNLRHSNIFFNLKNKNYEEAKKLLITLMGVGSKVADCILLFSLGHYNAFPVDTHIIKFMKKSYGLQMKKRFGKELEKITPLNIEEYGKEIYGDKAGIIQQYLFMYARYNL